MTGYLQVRALTRPFHGSTDCLICPTHAWGFKHTLQYRPTGPPSTQIQCEADKPLSDSAIAIQVCNRTQPFPLATGAIVNGAKDRACNRPLKLQETRMANCYSCCGEPVVTRVSGRCETADRTQHPDSTGLALTPCVTGWSYPLWQ